MGKTSKPLVILCDAEIINQEEIRELERKGHEIYSLGIADADLILSRVAWRMTPDLLKYLPIAIKAARTAKYPSKKGDKGENESD